MVTVITVSYFQTPNIGILNEKIETLCFFQVLGKTHHIANALTVGKLFQRFASIVVME